MYKTFHVFIGYDPAEHQAFLVAKNSLERLATVPVKVHKLDIHELRQAGLFKREWLIKENGQHICLKDGRPFSTQFSHSRFLVPELWRRLPGLKDDLVMFVDCDFVFLEDIKLMLKEINGQKTHLEGRHPLYCVQHDYNPKSETKMHGVQQSAYNMKLWTSLMVFDMSHPDNEYLTEELVNSEDGRNLHQFCWVSDIHSIGKISEAWNFIPDHSEKNTKIKNAIHWTMGGPWFKNLRLCRYADLWWKELHKYYGSKIKQIGLDLEDIVDT